MAPRTIDHDGTRHISVVFDGVEIHPTLGQWLVRRGCLVVAYMLTSQLNSVIYVRYEHVRHSPISQSETQVTPSTSVLIDLSY
jgi:hypothetical protein